MSKKKTLDRSLPKREVPKPAYNMPEPNDDMAAFGWDLSKIRHPAPGLKRGEVWSGPPAWSVPISREVLDTYGPDIYFLAPKYLQLCFDSAPEIREAAERAKAARYTKESIRVLQTTIQRVFKETVLPDLEKRFNEIAQMVAEFYAARLAHITKFGFDDEAEVK